jgi:hypothetical protein
MDAGNLGIALDLGETGRFFLVDFALPMLVWGIGGALLYGCAERLARFIDRSR